MYEAYVSVRFLLRLPPTAFLAGALADCLEGVLAMLETWSLFVEIFEFIEDCDEGKGRGQEVSRPDFEVI
jgi:hypothetical protein